MIPEDESRPLPPDPQFDALVRFIVGGILLLGGGFLLLEFIHWLANGGLKPFLMGTLCVTLFFFFLVLWSRLLASGGRSLRRRPTIYAAFGLLTTLGILVQHFLF